jgi:hypothetical protein
LVSKNEKLKDEITELIKAEEKIRKVRQKKEAEFRTLLSQQVTSSREGIHDN